VRNSSSAKAPISIAAMVRTRIGERVLPRYVIVFTLLPLRCCLYVVA
jgi:hypothetical protein